ncbi:D-alanyl-D-alanine carboxypeptidase family protein [Mesobacillus zeae]|uniref:D-alanyl-D-alanine carboxypeptidase family protein n=1 Tax=Mesobacillus zeae TaxID=1917180 RepID=A0A398B7K1_9BACI|nr:M15 family metallopeptidase [Mesobacillus zeae]RID85511.1 D-alanyl-D-alanine carboxypeptidase family protein [Mesobacillus zeae]
MKKAMLLLVIAAFLSGGCSSLDTGKLPFTKKETENHDNDGNKQADKDSSGTSSPSLEAAYFNDIDTVDGRKVIQNPFNHLALVNKDYALPSSYVPDDLVRANVAFSFGDQQLEKALLREEAAEAMEKMFNEAKQQGVELFAVSGYRSHVRQTEVFDAEVQRVGEEKAAEAVAYPGNSEHQTGLAMDISGQSIGFALSEEFGSVKEGHWLADHAHNFGFILRYPKGKEEITGYQYEPWHFRYVGKKAATEIYKNKWTLEEYFKTVRKI